VSNSASCRIYLATPPEFDPAAFASLLADALDSGAVAAVRLRYAHRDREHLAAAITVLRPIVQERDIAFLIDEDASLARALGCDGVQVDAKNVAASRAAIGNGASVGAFCGGSYHDAMTAAEDGADYVAWDAAVVTTETVSAWSAAMLVPCVVGGGLDIAVACRWAGAGTDFVQFGVSVWRAPEGPRAHLLAAAAALAKTPRIVEGLRGP
jgi:thiamine-phosphate pyrophosphorylase